MSASPEILFEKFEIIQCFKKDEHASVYLANHIYLGKKIILKVLNTETIFDEAKIERFKREAKILARLDHENVIKVLDFGTHEEYFYISFEYFESKNLRAFIKDKTLSDQQKSDLIIQLFKGLEYAHQNQIIHRDIKPENILVDKNYKLKIGDFGLALALNENFVTNQYSIVGTPCYMSPEQVQGKKLDVQSDLFSAGVVALEIFTGKNPFLGDDVNKTINKLINYSEENLLPYLQSVPENFRDIILKLLNKNPGKRYGSAAEVLKELDVPVEEIKTKPSVLSNRKIQVGAVLLVFLVVVSLILLTEKNNNAGKSVDTLTENESASDKTTVPESSKISGQKNPATAEPSASPPKVTEKENPPVNDNPDMISNKGKSEEKTAGEEKVNSFGGLYVECIPWAHIYINDRKLDTTPLNSAINLQTGTYNVKLVHPNYPEYTKTVNINAGEVTNIKVNLNELFGFLSCKVFPWGDLFLDDKLFGQTPFSEPIRLTAGKHILSVKNPNYPEYSDTIEIAVRETTFVQINLNKLSKNELGSNQ